MNRIQNKKSNLGTYEINKISLSCFDDKICIQNNGYDGLDLGYYSWYKKAVVLITTQKGFFVKHIVLIFSYSFFVRLLAWHVKFEKQKAPKKKISEGLMQ